MPVDCRDEFENTPLIIAAQNNKKRVCKLYLRQVLRLRLCVASCWGAGVKVAKPSFALLLFPVLGVLGCWGECRKANRFCSPPRPAHPPRHSLRSKSHKFPSPLSSVPTSTQSTCTATPVFTIASLTATVSRPPQLVHASAPCHIHQWLRKKKKERRPATLPYYPAPRLVLGSRAGPCNGRCTAWSQVGNATDK